METNASSSANDFLMTKSTARLGPYSNGNENNKGVVHRGKSERLRLPEYVQLATSTALVNVYRLTIPSIRGTMQLTIPQFDLINPPIIPVVSIDVTKVSARTLGEIILSISVLSTGDFNLDITGCFVCILVH